ncbi:hypothetical protein HDU98_000278 [Podochytrium sp. JEL0797]|nr:hypothetical protein HDU98_000278 [Podochytrium sp. JEL0797]
MSNTPRPCPGPHAQVPHSHTCSLFDDIHATVAPRSDALLHSLLYDRINAVLNVQHMGPNSGTIHFPPELVNLIVTKSPLLCNVCNKFHLEPCTLWEDCFNLIPWSEAKVGQDPNVPYSPTNMLMDSDSNHERCNSEDCRRGYCTECVDNSIKLCDSCLKPYCASPTLNCGTFASCVCECVLVCSDCVRTNMTLCGIDTCSAFFCTCVNCTSRLSVGCASCGLVVCRYDVCSGVMNECNQCWQIYCDECIGPHLKVECWDEGGDVEMEEAGDAVVVDMDD